MATEQVFDSRQAASAAAAEHIAELLRDRLAKEGQASFVVSGGTTPAQCFDFLSQAELDWGHVRVALSDERWVAGDHADSNERLVRETLLKNAAAEGDLLGIYQDDLTVDERCDSIESERPKTGFACAMVGMGADGHFASLFPDADSLQAGLKTDGHRFYIPVRTAASPHPRVSMTLAALLQSDEVLLLFFGDEKRAVYEQAKAGNSSYPIAALLQQTDVPVTLYWAP